MNTRSVYERARRIQRELGRRRWPGHRGLEDDAMRLGRVEPPTTPHFLSLTRSAFCSITPRRSGHASGHVDPHRHVADSPVRAAEEPSVKAARQSFMQHDEQCFVLDTNVWKSRRFLLLKTPLSAAFLYVLGQQRGCIGLPEVLEDEILKHLSRATLDYARQFEAAAEALRDLGIDLYHDAPLDEAYLSQVPVARLNALGTSIVRIPLSLDQVRRAAARVNNELPPNGPKNQQFKDSLVWEALLDLADQYDVVFVTADKGFFHDRDPTAGLAESLKQDCQRRHTAIRIVYADQFATLIQELQQKVPHLDREATTRAVIAASREEVHRIVEKHGTTLGDLLHVSVTPYLTGESGVLAVE